MYIRDTAAICSPEGIFKLSKVLNFVFFGHDLKLGYSIYFVFYKIPD